MLPKIAITIISFVSILAQASPWHPPIEGKIVRACGSISKEKTSWDGIQVVFEETDSAGKVIDRVFLSAAGKKLEEEFSYLKVGDKMAACVLGVKSERQPIDSFKTFHTFETY